MITSELVCREDEAIATIDCAGESFRVRWGLPEPSTVHSGDAAAATALLPAMALGQPLEVRPDVSPLLLERLETVQDVFVTWSRRKRLIFGGDPTYRRIPLEACSRTASPRPPSGDVAVFFSGGVDSFHTVLEHRSRVTALIFVHGVDVRLDDPQREAVAHGVRSAAEELGLPLIEVETDFRQFSDRFVPWADSHGAAFAAIAHLLADRFDTVLIPGSLTYDALYPLGSHPLLDPLWGSESVGFVHDGCDADRVEKVRTIARSPVARRWLRVCPHREGGTYNCGRCEKCLRTMAAARIAGESRSFDTLPPLVGPAMIGRVAAVDIRGRGTAWKSFWRITRHEGRDPALRWALSVALVRHRFRRRWELSTARRH